MTFVEVPVSVREAAKKSRTTGGIEPDDLKALRAGKTIFIEDPEANKRIASMRETIDYHRRKYPDTEKRRLSSRMHTHDGKPGKVVWLEER